MAVLPELWIYFPCDGRQPLALCLLFWKKIYFKMLAKAKFCLKNRR